MNYILLGILWYIIHISIRYIHSFLFVDSHGNLGSKRLDELIVPLNGYVITYKYSNSISGVMLSSAFSLELNGSELSPRCNQNWLLSFCFIVLFLSVLFTMIALIRLCVCLSDCCEYSWFDYEYFLW